MTLMKNHLLGLINKIYPVRSNRSDVPVAWDFPNGSNRVLSKAQHIYGYLTAAAATNSRGGTLQLLHEQHAKYFNESISQEYHKIWL